MRCIIYSLWDWRQICIKLRKKGSKFYVEKEYLC